MTEILSRPTYIPKDCEVSQHGKILRFVVPTHEWLVLATQLYEEEGFRLLSVVAEDKREQNLCFEIAFFFADTHKDLIVVPTLVLQEHEGYPSLSSKYREFAGYEAEIWTMFGIVPEGHAGLRRTVLHENWPDDIYPLRKDFIGSDRPERLSSTPYPFFEATGPGIYQIPVGPVHAGIIEPGHFRFSVSGEQVEYLDAQLGYVHKGIEKLFEQQSVSEGVALAERVSGDSSFAHALAYCQAIEQIAHMTVPPRAEYLRVVYAELERIANHFNDIGFIMLDTAYTFGGANGARLREQIMQIHERLTQSRFLRGVCIVGGVTKDIQSEFAKELTELLDAIHKDFSEVIQLTEESLTLADRLDGTGRLSLDVATDYGVTGVPLRALNIVRDARIDHPYAVYDALNVTIATSASGDVRARFAVRIAEVHESFRILASAISALPQGPISVKSPSVLPKNSYGIGIVEGWRGDIVTIVGTSDEGGLTRVKVRDTSFLNWQALPHTVVGEMVPDFPLINKSWNLSYSGNDL